MWEGRERARTRTRITMYYGWQKKPGSWVLHGRHAEFSHCFTGQETGGPWRQVAGLIDGCAAGDLQRPDKRIEKKKQDCAICPLRQAKKKRRDGKKFRNQIGITLLCSARIVEDAP